MTNSLAERIAAVRSRIAEAARRAGRDPKRITLVGVTKTHPPSVVREALGAGLLDIGESYVQELVEKHDAIGEPAEVRWHFIGHLQRNKVRFIAPFVHLIHGVDSLRLAREIDRQGGESGRVVPVLLQVNSSGEESKFGVAPDEAMTLAREITELRHVTLRGLMTIPAERENPEDVRPMFRLLARLREEIAQELSQPLPELSMGMTGDFEIAVEEGATLVRVGTALFGEREYTDETSDRA